MKTQLKRLIASVVTLALPIVAALAAGAPPWIPGR